MNAPKFGPKSMATLLAALSEGVLVKSDAELLEEARESFGDAEKHANSIRRAIASHLGKRGLNAEVIQTRKLQTDVGNKANLTVSKNSRSELSAARNIRTAVSDSEHKRQLGTSLRSYALSTYFRWTNRSIVQFAKGESPFKVMCERAESLVLKALESGWEGPPYDPFRLAQLLRINVVPRSDIAEARTISDAKGGFLIEFNPRQPASRIRFSIAHEIAHTFFPDCLERARYRASRKALEGDDWQLEMLCNVGAAEILMPAGSFSSLREEGFDIVRLMDLRKTFGVSTEAILLRIVKLSKTPLACFVASSRDRQLRIDYAAFSAAWHSNLSNRVTLPKDTLAHECAAIGLIASGSEIWSMGGTQQEVDIQAVGLPAYQNGNQIRVAGIVRPKQFKASPLPSVEYAIGNALQPKGKDAKIVAHIVNDTTPRWGGGGFAAALRSEWPEIQDDFKSWAFGNKESYKLGITRFARHSNDISVASMVAQHGYGPSERPRIRYAPLEECLRSVGDIAVRENCTVHMPKIGTGQAAGNWAVIEELIERILCSRGLRVVVYQLKK